MFNNSGLFMFLFFQLCFFIIMTAVILGIHNLITKKNKATHYDVLFISTSSYSPFAISLAITYFTLQFSMLLGIILIGMGYALSLNLLMTNLSQLKIVKTL